jgi:mono/diheme cytochrome c family protein
MPFEKVNKTFIKQDVAHGLNKQELAVQRARGQVQQFHETVCLKCHAPTQYGRWWNATAPFSVPYLGWESVLIHGRSCACG